MDFTLLSFGEMTLSRPCALHQSLFRALILGQNEETPDPHAPGEPRAPGDPQGGCEAQERGCLVDALGISPEL